MITTQTLARKTGLSSKTLTRWANQGIIPKPAVSTHPSGRGKIGYWPDSVLDRCLRLVRLRKEGHSVDSSVALLGLEDVQKNVDVAKKPSFADLLAQRKVKRPNGEEVDLLQLLCAVIAGRLKESVLDRDQHRTILDKLQGDHRLLLRRTIDLIGAGYNPYLTYDGTTVRIEPDFLLGHPPASEGLSCFSLPLRPPVRKLLALFGAEECMPQTRVEAAPKVWIREADTIVEYDIFLAGPLGFELLRESSRTIGVTPKSEGNNEPS